MAKGSWKTCPLTGLSVRKLSEVDESYLNDDGAAFNPAAFPDCNIFDVRSFAAAAGYKSGAYDFEARVLTDPSSPFHAHPIRTISGRLVGYATHTDSAAAGGFSHRRKTHARQIAKLKQYQDGSDVSSGERT